MWQHARVTNEPTDEGRLEELERAFDAGNYAAVRAGAAPLIASKDDRTKARALMLYEKTQPDPSVKWLFLLTLVVVLCVTAYWMKAR